MILHRDGEPASGTNDSIDAVGRQRRCLSCRRLLEVTDDEQTTATCQRCGTVNALPTKLINSWKPEQRNDDATQPVSGADHTLATESNDNVAAPELSMLPELPLPSSRIESANTTEQGGVGFETSDDSELTLSPSTSPRSSTSPRTEAHGTSPQDTNSTRCFGIVFDDENVQTEVDRSELARQTYNSTSGIYPKERHYPTLEAMQRLYKLFGYVATLLVFPYLFFRVSWIIWTTEEGLLHELAAFSEFAVPLIFGTVALIGTLFAASEGIRLAVDIQDNTLRIANRAGRRKE